MTCNRPLSQLVRFVAFGGFLLLTAYCSLLTVAAQTATANLSGTIQDQNGASIPGVQVTIENTGTTLKREATTNDEGSFTVPLLPPGHYVVTARREGFSPVQINDVVLNVGDQKALKIELKAGDVNATVQVTNEAPLINESPAVGTVVDRRFVGNLPLNGRSFQSLIQLTPGVVLTPSTPDKPGEFSVNGQRTNTNYFTVDGVSANIGVDAVGIIASAFGARAGGSTPGNNAVGTTSSMVSIDALEEFRIQTSTYSAEFGRQPGAQVQLVTRSGVNQFHGSAFDYLRNEIFDANNWFTNSRRLTAQQIARGITKQPRLPLRQNQFGATFSGPVMLPRFGEGGKTYWSGRNKTFFFFSYEGQRLLQPQLTITATKVPSLRLRSVAHPAVQPLLNAYPVPTEPETQVGNPPVFSGGAPYSTGVSNPSSVDAYSIRLDHMIGGNLRLFGRYSETPSHSLTRSLNLLSGRVHDTRTLTVGATHSISPRLNNDFRFNWSRNRGRASRTMDNFGGAIPIDASQVISGYSGSGNTFGFVSIGLSATSTFFNQFQLGNEVDNYSRQINIVDNVSLVTGAHQLKFGMDWRRLTPVFGPREYSQLLLFTSEQEIILGRPFFTLISAFRGARPIYNNVSAYVQDTWKLSSRLTLDLGVRWELNPPPYDANGVKPVLVTNITPTDVSGASLAPSGTPFYKTIYTAFAPRVGVAYVLRQAQGRETVLRGGFGAFYDLGGGGAAQNGFQDFPFSSSISLRGAQLPLTSAQAQPPGFPPVALPLTDIAVNALNSDLKLPYTLQWNVALQQSLGTQQTVTLSYVAAAARRLLTMQRLNQLVGSPMVRPNPNFGDISYTFNGPTSDYQSLQAQYQRRLSRGLQALASYTWSHAIDEVSNEVDPGILDRGNADFDVRHNFSAAITYDLPKLRGGWLLAGVVNGWSVDSIFFARTGTPLNLSSGSFVRPDGTFVNPRPNVAPGVSSFWLKDPSVPGGRRLNPAAFLFPGTTTVTHEGNLARNSIYTPGIYQINLAVRRQFNLTESVNLQVKAEAFNAINHPLFGGYNAVVGFIPSLNRTLGVPTRMLSTSLGTSGLNSLYQIGGPRSIQLSLRLSF